MIDKVIFHKTSKNPIPFSECNIEIEDDDILTVGHQDGFYSENNSHDPYYLFAVNRMVLETDDEEKVRIENAKRDQRYLKKHRRESYLKLKEEFEKEGL